MQKIIARKLYCSKSITFSLSISTLRMSQEWPGSLVCGVFRKSYKLLCSYSNHSKVCHSTVFVTQRSSSLFICVCSIRSLYLISYLNFPCSARPILFLKLGVIQFTKCPRLLLLVCRSVSKIGEVFGSIYLVPTEV